MTKKEVNLDAAKIDDLEAGLDQLIERRGRGNKAAREREAAYAESVRKYHARRQQQLLWDRLRFHERMIDAHTASFEDLLEHHRSGIQRCKEALREGVMPVPDE